MWSTECSVECSASREFAWQFWTNVSNWPVIDSAIEVAEIDGPFAAGAKITTKPSGHPSTVSEVVEVEDGHRAVIEIPIPGAVLKCFWGYEDFGNGTRITQRMVIEGNSVDDYSAIEKMMEQTLPQGMQRVADAIAQNYK